MPPSREARIGIANGEFSLEIPFIFRSDEQKMWNGVEYFAVRRTVRAAASAPLQARNSLYVRMRSPQAATR